MIREQSFVAGSVRLEKADRGMTRLLRSPDSDNPLPVAPRKLRQTKRKPKRTVAPRKKRTSRHPFGFEEAMFISNRPQHRQQRVTKQREFTNSGEKELDEAMLVQLSELLDRLLVVMENVQKETIAWSEVLKRSVALLD